MSICAFIHGDKKGNWFEMKVFKDWNELMDQLTAKGKEFSIRIVERDVVSTMMVNMMLSLLGSDSCNEIVEVIVPDR